MMKTFVMALIVATTLATKLTNQLESKLTSATEADYDEAMNLFAQTEGKANYPKRLAQTEGEANKPLKELE